MAQYISANTAMCGVAQCGVMECGTYGLYETSVDGTVIEKSTFTLTIGSTTFQGASGITWSHSLGSDNASQCSFSLYNFRPDLYERVELNVCGQPIWIGFVTSYSTSYVGGTLEEDNFTIEFKIDAVSREHWLTRYYVTESFQEDYAGAIIKKLLWEYCPSSVHIGTIERGKYYEDLVYFENEQLSSIISRLADASDCYYYIDQYSRFNFRTKYEVEAPIDIDYEMTRTWKISRKYPDNNYHGTSTSVDGSNIFTVVKIKGIRFAVHRAYFENIHWYQDGTNPRNIGSYVGTLPIPYITTVEQKEIYTPSPIYDVNTIYIVFMKMLPNLSDPTGELLYELHEATYSHPTGGQYYTTGFEKGWNSAGCLGTTLQYEYILGKDSQWMIDPSTGEKRKVDLNDLNKTRKTYWSTLLTEPATWTPQVYDRRLAWETLEVYSGKEKFSPLLTIMEQFQLSPAFTWNVSYGGNSVSFQAPYEFKNTEEYAYYMRNGYVEYVESIPYTYRVESNKASTYGKDGSGKAMIEHTVEDSGVTNSTIAKEYADALFKQNENGTEQVSYSHYMIGTEILSRYLRPGMYQNLRLHNKSWKLGIESVSYSIISFSPFVVKVDVSLSTKTKNLEEILSRLLKY